MRATWAAASGLSIGLALGWGGAEALLEAPAGPLGAQGTRPAEPAPPVPVPATLARRAEPTKTAPVEPGRVVRLDVRALLAGALPQQRKRGPTPPAWVDVARVLARIERWSEVAELLVSAVEAGGSAGDAAAVLRLLPDPDRARACAALRAAGHGDVVDPWLEATATATEPADLDRLLAVLPAGGEDFTDTVRRLALLDARRADSALVRLAHERGWKSDGLALIAEGFRRAGADDLATGWRTRTAEALAREEDALWAERRKALGESPPTVEGLVELASIQERDGDHGGALRTLAQALSIDAFDESALETLLDLDPRAAIPWLEAASGRMSASLLRSLVEAEIAEGRLERAAAMVLLLPDDDARTWWEAGIGAFDPAAVLRFLDGRPRAGAFARARGDALGAMGRPAEAYEEWLAAFDAYDEDLDFLRALAAAQPAKAAAFLERERASRTGNGAVALAAIEARRLAGPSGEALAALRSLAENGGLDAVLILAEGGDETALARLAEETTLRPGDSEAWWRLGQAHARRGAIEAAKSAWDRALAIQAKDPVWLACGRDPVWLVRRAALR